MPRYAPIVSLRNLGQTSTPIPAGPEPETIADAGMAGLRAGWGNVKATSRAYLASGLDAVGANEMATSQYALAQEASKEAQLAAPQVQDYQQVLDSDTPINTGLRYVAGQVGQGISSTLPGVATGLGLAALTRGRAGPVAQFGAMSAGMLPQEAGESALTMQNDPEAMANTTALQRFGINTGKGTVNSILESVVPTMLGGKLLTRTAAPTLGAAARTALGTIGKAYGTEALTEAAQEYVGQAAHTVANPERDKTHDTHHIINAGIGGGFAGAGMSTPVAGIRMGLDLQQDGTGGSMLNKLISNGSDALKKAAGRKTVDLSEPADTLDGQMGQIDDLLKPRPAEEEKIGGHTQAELAALPVEEAAAAIKQHDEEAPGRKVEAEDNEAGARALRATMENLAQQAAGDTTDTDNAAFVHSMIEELFKNPGTTRETKNELLAMGRETPTPEIMRRLSDIAAAADRAGDVQYSRQQVDDNARTKPSAKPWEQVSRDAKKSDIFDQPEYSHLSDQAKAWNERTLDLHIKAAESGKLPSRQQRADLTAMLAAPGSESRKLLSAQEQIGDPAKRDAFIASMTAGDKQQTTEAGLRNALHGMLTPEAKKSTTPEDMERSIPLLRHYFSEKPAKGNISAAEHKYLLQQFETKMTALVGEANYPKLVELFAKDALEKHGRSGLTKDYTGTVQGEQLVAKHDATATQDLEAGIEEAADPFDKQPVFDSEGKEIRYSDATYFRGGKAINGHPSFVLSDEAHEATFPNTPSAFKRASDEADKSGHNANWISATEYGKLHNLTDEQLETMLPKNDALADKVMTSALDQNDGKPLSQKQLDRAVLRARLNSAGLTEITRTSSDSALSTEDFEHMRIGVHSYDKGKLVRSEGTDAAHKARLLNGPSVISIPGKPSLDATRVASYMMRKEGKGMAYTQEDEEYGDLYRTARAFAEGIAAASLYVGKNINVHGDTVVINKGKVTWNDLQQVLKNGHIGQAALDAVAPLRKARDEAMREIDLTDISDKKKIHELTAQWRAASDRVVNALKTHATANEKSWTQREIDRTEGEMLDEEPGSDEYEKLAEKLAKLQDRDHDPHDALGKGGEQGATSSLQDYKQGGFDGGLPIKQGEMVGRGNGVYDGNALIDKVADILGRREAVKTPIEKAVVWNADKKTINNEIARLEREAAEIAKGNRRLRRSKPQNLDDALKGLNSPAQDEDKGPLNLKPETANRTAALENLRRIADALKDANPTKLAELKDALEAEVAEHGYTPSKTARAAQSLQQKLTGLEAAFASATDELKKAGLQTAIRITKEDIKREAIGDRLIDKVEADMAAVEDAPTEQNKAALEKSKAMLLTFRSDTKRADRSTEARLAHLRKMLTGANGDEARVEGLKKAIKRTSLKLATEERIADAEIAVRTATYIDATKQTTESRAALVKANAELAQAQARTKKYDEINGAGMTEIDPDGPIGFAAAEHKGAVRRKADFAGDALDQRRGATAKTQYEKPGTVEIKDEFGEVAKKWDIPGELAHPQEWAYDAKTNEMEFIGKGSPSGHLFTPEAMGATRDLVRGLVYNATNPVERKFATKARVLLENFNKLASRDQLNFVMGLRSKKDIGPAVNKLAMTYAGLMPKIDIHGSEVGRTVRAMKQEVLSGRPNDSRAEQTKAISDGHEISDRIHALFSGFTTSPHVLELIKRVVLPENMSTEALVKVRDMLRPSRPIATENVRGTDRTPPSPMDEKPEYTGFGNENKQNTVNQNVSHFRETMFSKDTSGRIKAVTLKDRGLVMISKEAKLTSAQRHAVLLHEIGVHYGLEKMIGADEFRTMIENMRSMRGKVAAVTRAYASVPVETPVDMIDEEAIGYLVEHSAALPLVARLLARIEMWFRKMFNGVKYTPADIRQLALAALKKYERDVSVRTVAGLRETPTEGFVRVDADSALDSSPRAARILSTLMVGDGKQLGQHLALTGSLALSRQQPVFRAEDEQIHDLDFTVVGKISKDAIKNAIEKIFPGAAVTAEFRGSDKSVLTLSMYIPDPGFKNLVVIKTGGKVSAVHASGPDNIVADAKGMVLDFFIKREPESFVQGTIGGMPMKLTDAKHINHAKGLFGRAKDVNDFMWGGQEPVAYSRQSSAAKTGSGSRHAIQAKVAENRSLHAAATAAKAAAKASQQAHNEARRLDRSLPEQDFGPEVGKQSKIMRNLDKLHAELQQELATQNADDGRMTDAQMAEDIAEITRLLGADNVRVRHGWLTENGQSYAGSFTKALHDANGATITKATIALNSYNFDPAGVRYHEALHAWFAQLYQSKNGAVIQEFLKFVRSPAVMKQLREAFKNEPDVLKQIEDSEEEAAAYTYQLWTSGNLTIAENANGILGQIKEFLQRVFGIWSTSKRGEKIMEYFHSGKYAENMGERNVVHRMLVEHGRNKHLTSLQPYVGQAAKVTQALLGVGSARVRDFNIPAWTEAMDRIARHSNDAGTDRGYLPAATARIRAVMNQVAAELLEPYDMADIREAFHQMQSKTGTDKHPEIKQVMRNIFDRQYKEMGNAAIKMGFLSDYVPVMWDTGYIAGHRDEFIKMLNKAKAMGRLEDAGTAEEVLARFMAEDGADIGMADVELSEGSARPGMQFLKTRFLDIDDADRQPFLIQDPVLTIASYVRQSIRRTEWAKQFRDDGSGLEMLLKKGREQGGTQEQEDVVRKYISGIDGSLGSTMSPNMRKWSATMMVASNLRLLGLGWFSSLLDAGGVRVRGGEWSDTWNTYKLGMSQIMRGWQKDPKPNAALKFAEDVGVIEKAVLGSAVMSANNVNTVTGSTRRINDWLFKVNLMEQQSKNIRAGAAVAAAKFIARHNDSSGEHSERWLAEIGLRVGEAKIDAEGNLVVFDNGSAYELKMKQAINTWVDSAVPRPDQTKKAIWANDPYFALIAHMKTYTFAFHDTILKRIVHEAGYANYGPAYALMGYIPAMFAADMVKGMLQGGGDLPEWKKDWGPWDFFWSAVQRAGFLGTGQFAYDELKGVSAHNYFNALGPTASFAEHTVSSINKVGGLAEFGRSLVPTSPADYWLKGVDKHKGGRS